MHTTVAMSQARDILPGRTASGDAANLAGGSSLPGDQRLRVAPVTHPVEEETSGFSVEWQLAPGRADRSDS